MNAKEQNRRRFLKKGAALAGFAVGAIRSASGQTPGSEIPEVHPKDLHVYGERSRFVNLVRASRPRPADSLRELVMIHTLRFGIR